MSIKTYKNWDFFHIVKDRNLKCLVVHKLLFQPPGEGGKLSTIANGGDDQVSVTKISSIFFSHFGKHQSDDHVSLIPV